MNSFVDYLNSMNSVKSDNRNALAESQILSEYYSKIAVERKIGDVILEMLTQEKCSIILTGHAGDGKTSILVQILTKLGYFDGGKKSLKTDEVFKDIHYIKDMSELDPEVQTKLLIKLLDAPFEQRSSIIVSNTGPLITSFNSIFDDKSQSEPLENKILEGIGQVISEPIEFLLDTKLYKFRIINIANIDNSYLVKEIFEKITNKELWQSCYGCDKSHKCPISNNYNDLIKHKDQLVEQITKIYYWLNVKGTRLTIRQLIAHITYSLTANLKCQDIDSFEASEDLLFRYSFVNSFFGYKGLHKSNDSRSIKVIRELENYDLDEITLDDIDYQLFVNDEKNCFSNNISELLINITNKNSNTLDKQNSNNMRKAIRRYYFLFSNEKLKSKDYLNSVIMSEAILDYYKAVTGEHFDTISKRKFEKIIFTALYRLFVGVYPQKGESNLYITLRKNFNIIQNTQMIIGKVPRNEIQIELRSKKNLIEPERVQSELYIVAKDVEFHVSADFLEFLYKLHEGKVFTELHPSFTFCVSRLKSDLLSAYKTSDESIELLIIQKQKIKKILLKVDENNIFIN